jgi:hypothetical protein
MTLEKSPFFNNIKVSKFTAPNDNGDVSQASSLFHSRVKRLSISKNKEGEDTGNYNQMASPNPEKNQFKNNIKKMV